MKSITEPVSSIYLYKASYQDYLESKIQNEETIMHALGQYIPVNEAAYKEIRILTEAKLGDKIKSKMQRFIDFIKNLLAKFMESMTKLLLDEKGYLEKYKDIILNKKPKDDLTFSCNGNFKTAIDRCINTSVPIFNYSTHAEALKEDSDAKFVNMIMGHKSGFKYEEDETLATIFKNYFLALDDESNTEGKFSQLNFHDMYNFCYNFKKIEDICKKDQNYIEQSTRAITTAAINANKQAAINQQPQSTPKVHQNATFVSPNYFSRYFNEANDGDNSNGEQQTSGGQQDNNKPKDGAVKITDTSSSNPINKMNSTENRDRLTDDQAKAGAQGSENEKENDILDIGQRFINICQTLIAAKCTAVQSIAKSYMEIIRAHVRSYVGKSDNKMDNRTKQSSSKYDKDNQNNGEQKEESKGGEQKEESKGGEQEEEFKGEEQEEGIGTKVKNFFMGKH